MQAGCKGFDLLLQFVDQLTTGAQRNGWDVVNRFVAIQLNALTAHMGQGIDDVATDVLQTELKGLEQTDGACTHNDGIGLNRHGAYRLSSASLPVLSFQSSASGRGALRLVMLGQPMCDNSALSWVMCSWPWGTSSSA